MLARMNEDTVDASTTKMWKHLYLLLRRCD